jgi:hypothetical protein
MLFVLQRYGLEIGISVFFVISFENRNPNVVSLHRWKAKARIVDNKTPFLSRRKAVSPEMIKRKVKGGKF